MNRYHISILCIISTCVIYTTHAAIGCMDTSKHGDLSAGYDYKTLHFVPCSCPCERHRHISRRGQCIECRHYRAPQNH